MSISPDGRHIAYIQRIKNIEYFVVALTDTKEIVGSVNAKKIKARSTSFATNNHVLFQASKTNVTLGYRGRHEFSAAIGYTIDEKKVTLLLKGTQDIHPAQTGLGKIVGLDVDKEVVYMPAFDEYGSKPYNLYQVNLNTGVGRIYTKGKSGTIDWFVGEKGQVLAREDYDEDTQTHSIVSKTSGKWKTIYSLSTPIPSISVQAISSDGGSLIFIDQNDDREAVYSIALDDGEITGPIFSKPDADIDFLDTDVNRRLTAIVYSGFKSDYTFIDERENQLFDRLSVTFPKSNIQYQSATADKSTILVKVSGAEKAGAYMLFDTEKATIKQFAVEYDVDTIAELKAVKYKARDGLDITAIITFPPEHYGRKNLPLIALPHGGPESYDKIHFDWLAQYLATKGYLVLQPNFRGSSGFGYQFRNAGRGRWGQEMQDDVSDGVRVMVASGYADAERACIMGMSYGGYSALAGGAFSPELYKCIISVNGVTDLPLMMRDTRYRYGSKHWVVSYWNEVIGDSTTQAEKLKSISPVNFAHAFQAPVLLIHGKDDLVVPIQQSKGMQKALKKAGKKVIFKTLKGEDHWLSTSASRLLALKAIDAFLNKYNPVHLTSAHTPTLKAQSQIND
jgi:dipeptidyl aminopeptidase/acylaminoacyl peptidase